MNKVDRCRARASLFFFGVLAFAYFSMIGGMLICGAGMLYWIARADEVESHE